MKLIIPGLILLVLGSMEIGAAPPDDPIVCAGAARRYEDERARLSRDQMAAQAASLQRSCPRLAEHIRGALPPLPPPSPPIVMGSECHPRIVRITGAHGQATQSLLQLGNRNCIEADYGGEMVVEVNLCDSKAIPVTGVTVERQSVADGRLWSSAPPVTYQLIGGDGSASVPQPLGRGYARLRRETFPAQSAVGLRIAIRNPRSYGYPVAEQLCSITVAN